MNFYEAKSQGKFSPIRILAKVFASTATIAQCRSRQDRSKYTGSRSIRDEHSNENLDQRLEDFNNV